VRAQASHRFGCRVAIGVASAGADHRDAWLQRVQPCFGRGCPATVMRDLEHIQASAVRLADTTLEQRRVDIVLDVASEEHPPLDISNVEHDGRVIDGAPDARRARRHRTPDRPQDIHGDAIEGQTVARRKPTCRYMRHGQPGTERCITGSCAEHPVLGDGGDPIALDEHRQPRDVVLMWVSEDDEVQPTVPRGHISVEDREQAVGVGPAVEQDPSAPWPFDEDGVALAHVQDGHGQTSRTGPVADHDAEASQGRHGNQSGRHRLPMRRAAR